VSNFKDLPSSKYDVIKGEIMTRKEVKEKKLYSRAKTIDFYWEYRNCKFWAAHKYTKQEGGAQGNQYRELQEFLLQSKGNRSNNTFFIAIADGDFYQGNNGKAGVLRIDKLKELADEPNIAACVIDDLENLMKKIPKSMKEPSGS